MSRITVLLVSLTSLFICDSAVQGQNYNLGSDWSDVSNPNGVWGYRQGTTLLSSGTWSFDFTPQTAWLGGIPAVWLKAQSTAGFDVAVGDVVTHTATTTNPLTNIVWTSPVAGTIDINGGVWMIRDIGRANNWFVRHNGSLLSSGSLSSGDPFNRASPFNLDAGSGGVLNSIAVIAGDQIELSFQTTGNLAGDYVGVNLGIILTAVPEPGSLALMGLAAAGVALGAWRKCRQKRPSK